MRRLRPLPPTGTGGTCLALAALMTLVGLRSPSTWLLMIACALLAPVVFQQVARPPLEAVAVRLHLPPRAAVGTPVAMLVEVTNEGRRRLPAMRLEHRVPGFAVARLAVPALGPGARAELRLTRPALARCAPARHDVRLVCVAPFGVTTLRRPVPASGSSPVRIHPARVSSPVATAVLRTAGTVAGRPLPGTGGGEIHGLREWRPGDSVRQVHWRATARHQELTVAVPERPSGIRLACVVVAPVAEPTLAAAAWAVADLLAGGGEAHLRGPGLPPLTTGTADDVLDWFAGVRASSPSPAEPELAAARAWASSGGGVVLVTGPDVTDVRQSR